MGGSGRAPACRRGSGGGLPPSAKTVSVFVKLFLYIGVEREEPLSPRSFTASQLSMNSNKTPKTEKTEDHKIETPQHTPNSKRTLRRLLSSSSVTSFISLSRIPSTPQMKSEETLSKNFSKTQSELMQSFKDRTSRMWLAFWRAKGSSELLEHLVIFIKRLAFIWDFFTDILLIVQLLSNGYVLWGHLCLLFAILPYPCMSRFVGHHYIAIIQERKGLPYWAAFLLWYALSIFFFLYNDVIILFEYMFAEPCQNELFTYIRVRQLNMVLFEAIPQSVLGLVILLSQQGEEEQVIDTKVVVTSFFSSVMSCLLYAVIIRKYAKVHCNGSVYQYRLY